MMNPFAARYAGFNVGTGAEKLAALGDFPSIIDVEATNACQFKCLQCPTGNMSMRRPTGMMTKETFAKIVAQAAEHDTWIRFILWGEPLLNKDIVHFVWLVNGAGLESHINTNGQRLTRELTKQLIWAGLSSLKFSFQGVDRRTYRDMRNIDFFEPLLATIKMVRQARDAANSNKRPWLHASTSITDETPEMVEFFRRRIEAYLDAPISVGKTIFGFNDLKAVRLKPEDRKRLEKFAAAEDVTKLRHPDPCPEVYSKLAIAWDGTARVCCNDYDGHTNLGNVNQTPISEIWQHPTMRAYRERLAEKDYGGPLCSVCYDYQELTEGA